MRAGDLQRTATGAGRGKMEGDEAACKPGEDNNDGLFACEPRAYAVTAPDEADNIQFK